MSLLGVEDLCRFQTSTPALDSAAAALSSHKVAQIPVLTFPSWDLDCWEIQQICISWQHVWNILRGLKWLWAAGSVFSKDTGRTSNWRRIRTVRGRWWPIATVLFLRSYFGSTLMHRIDFICLFVSEWLLCISGAITKNLCVLLSTGLTINSLSEF